MKKTILVLGLIISVSLAAAAVSGQTIVINEIDYDQIGTDTAEFIELKNTGAVPINLDNYSLVLVNGSGTAIYQTIDLPNFVLNPGFYFVVCGNAANVVICNLDVLPDSDLIQNGAPDAVALVLAGSPVDTVSYEGNTGAPYTEGTGVSVAQSDSNTVGFIGLSRIADGADTNNNSVDLSLRCISPGMPNLAANTGCVAPQAPTAARVSLAGRVVDSAGRGLANVIVEAKNMNGVTIGTARSTSFGYFTVEGLNAGDAYAVHLNAKRFTFTPRVITMNDNVEDVVFAPNEK